MKKKGLDIRSTLKPKVELGKHTKKLNLIESELTEIHCSKTNEKEDYFRTTIYLPKTLHTELKIYVAQNDGLSMKKFISQAVMEKMSKVLIEINRDS